MAPEIIIQKKMVCVNKNYEDQTEFPNDQSFDGKYVGKGYKNFYNLYKGAWNPKRKMMAWSFVMHVDKTKIR